MPDACALQKARFAPAFTNAGHIEQSASMRCGRVGLEGRQLSIAGLDAAGVAVLVRIQSKQTVSHAALLEARTPAWTVATTAQVPAVGTRYFMAGFEHLLIGLDYVFLVVALALLIAGWRRLLITVTAFTLGHSISLAASSFGWRSLPQAWIEIVIALSLVPLALTLIKPRASRWQHHLPWLVVFAGLLHGLGFAGALADLGLPTEQRPLAVLSFKLGIELAQLLLVIVVIGLKRLVSASPSIILHRWVQLVPAYAIGSIACYWCMERLPLIAS